MKKKYVKIFATSYIFPWLRLFQRHDYPVAELLENLDIPPTALHAKNYKITLEQQREILQQVLTFAREQDLIALLVDQMKLADHGIVSNLILTRATMKQAINVLLLFYKLRNRMFRFSYHETDTQAVLRVELKHGVGTAERFVMEVALRSLLKAKQQVLTVDNRDNVIRFKHARLMPHPIYQDTEYCQYEFEQDHYEIAFPLSHLAYKLRVSHCRRQEQLELKCREVEHILNADASSFADKITCLLAHCETSYPSLQEIAAMLNSSTRTINRHLQKLGVGYQRLIDADRIRRSKELFQRNEFTLDDIAGCLNFADTAHFCHVFKRHTGLTPSQYRRTKQAVQS